MNFDKLQQEAESLVSILKDRQTGCFTWWQAVTDKVNNIALFTQHATILYENMSQDHQFGWYSRYKPKSFGCVLHWVYVYAGLSVADRVEFKNDHVISIGGGCEVGYKWENDIPVFDFC